MQIETGPKMSLSHLHHMNGTENNETISIPDDHTTKDQNEVAIHLGVNVDLTHFSLIFGRGVNLLI